MRESTTTAPQSGQTTLRWSEPPEGSSTTKGRAQGSQRPTKRAVAAEPVIWRCGLEVRAGHALPEGGAGLRSAPPAACARAGAGCRRRTLHPSPELLVGHWLASSRSYGRSEAGSDAEVTKADAARKRLADCDRRLVRYRAALDSGADPSVVTAWIAEVQAERLSAEVDLDRATGRGGNGRLSRDQLAALVNGLGSLLGVLADAAPEDKVEVYRPLGLRLTYDPAQRVVIAEADPWRSAGARKAASPSPTSSPSASTTRPDPVGKSQCRRGGHAR